MEESIYFSHQGISVSNTRFIVNGTPIAIKNVTTVESKTLEPKLTFARVCLLGGLALLFGNGNLPYIGFFSMVYGGMVWLLATPKYAVVIHTVAGDIQAFIGENILDVENVLTALNVAIALRGAQE
jgi:energy-converting hydrogenase Eha subunit C